MQRALGDERRAEALFLVALSMVLLALLLGQFLAWVALKEAILAAPDGPVAVAFWLAQGAGVALCLLTCVIGFRPAVTVRVEATGLTLRQGRRALTLAYDEIAAARPLPARRFHRHYARYAATQVFANRYTPEVVLIETARGPVVVGLLPDDQADLLRRLQAPRAPAFHAPAARVA